MEDKKHKTEITVKEGIVGVFDVLGFQNYIKNDPDVASKSALEVMLEVKSEAPRKVKERVRDKILDEITWIVLSDTIIISIPYTSANSEDLEELKLQKVQIWMALLLSAAALLDHMFDSGLPVRGGISFGKYFANEQSLAGKSVVDAFSLAQKLDLSGAAIASSGMDELSKLVPAENLVKATGKAPIFFPYLVPLKGSVSEKMLIVNQWTFHDKYDNHDIPQLVAQAFWKHDKDIDIDVLQKLQNTEMLLRYVVAMKRSWRS